MTISTNYNPSTLLVQRNLGNASNAMNLALERMSTGFRVNCAADDAAGLYVSTGLTTQIRGLLQGKKNTQDGISLINTASGSLGNMKDILQRLRDLSVQASNGVYSDEAMSAMQAEADALTEQLYQIKNGTNFNGLNIFSKRGENFAPIVRNANIRTVDSGVMSVKSYLGQSSKPNAGAERPNESIPESHPPLDDSSAIQGHDPNYEEPVYEPGVQMTGEQMSDLKYWLNAGESHDDFVAQFSSGKSTGEILASKGIEKPIFEPMPMAVVTNGTVDFAAGESKVVTIDGVNYTIKNTQTTAKSLMYSKEDSGVLTFEGSNFEIRGAADESHNLEIKGSHITIYGGDMNDCIVFGASATSTNMVYAGAGNDEIINNSKGRLVTYLHSGNNTYTKNSEWNCAIYGGTGNDTFNLNNTSGSGLGGLTIETGDGDNVINFRNNANSYKIIGGNGNNTYNFDSTISTGNLIIDNTGNNIINNNANNAQTNNMISGNFTVNGMDKFLRVAAMDFSANETKSNITLIDGKSYTIKNNLNTDNLMIWKMVGDRLTLVGSKNFTMTANEATKIDLSGSGSMVLYGSDYDDDIIFAEGTLYSGLGNNTIKIINAAQVYLQGGDNDVTVTGANSRIYGEKGNNTFYIHTSKNAIYGGDGNNTFYMNTNNAIAYGGVGNDKFIVKSGVTGVSCIGGGGTNTVEGNLAGTKFLADISNAINNATSVLLAGNEIANVNINGANYSFQNQIAQQKYAAYSVGIDGTVSLIASQSIIRAQKDVYNKIDTYGYDQSFFGGDVGNIINIYQEHGNVYGGKGDDSINNNSIGGSVSINCTSGGDDTITINKNIGNEIRLGNGNNKIILNATTIGQISTGTGDNHYVINTDNTVLTGGNGNNTYEINANNCNITGGTGKDTFLVNGNNNQAFGAAGDDYFVISSGTNNTVIGGSGNNYIVDKGIGTTTPMGDVVNDPHSGFLYFTDNSTSQSLTLFGKTYKVTNTTTEGSLLSTNQLQYAYNENTGEITFYGDNFTIEAENGRDHKMVIRGSNNLVKGGDGDDRITIESGSNNRIEGTSGKNTIIANTAGNKLIGGSGNDYISSDFTQTLVEGTAGSNTIVINADNTTIKGGTGTDKITVKGQGNNVDGGVGNDNIFVDGTNNSINSSSGSNTIAIKGTQNSLTETGDTNNTIAIEGEDNNATVGNGNNKITVITTNTNTKGNTITAGNGGNSFNIQGNLNTINSGDGADSFVINGSTNDIKSGSGNDNINLNFGSNNTIDSGNGSDVITVKANSNTIAAGTGNDTITVTGSENKVSSSDGENIFNISGSKNEIQGGIGKDTINIGGSENIALGRDGDDYFNIKYGAIDSQIDGEGGNNEMFNKGNNTIFNNVKDITPDPVIIRLQVGTDSTQWSAISFETEFYIGEFALDFSSAGSAVENISKIDELLNRINTKNSQFGAILNRLDSVLQSQAIQIENLTASRSTIIDADIAEESAIFVKNQILQQTSATLLSLSQSFHKSIILGLIT